MLRGRTKGSLTELEKRIVKRLLNDNWRVQDIHARLNIGREVTVNMGRLSPIRDKNISPATDPILNTFNAAISTYNHTTGLNEVDDERLVRSIEAMSMAVSLFNSANLSFKTEVFCVLSNIAWTYALHEFYHRRGVEIYQDNGLSLLISQMIKRDDCPLTEAERENIKAVNKIRDNVEHKTMGLSDPKWYSIFQANCLNFDRMIRYQFGDQVSLANDLKFALQFSQLSMGQATKVQEYELPDYISALDIELNSKAFVNPADAMAYSFKVVYTLDSASKGTANVKFLAPGTAESDAVHNILVKHKPADELYPFKPSEVVSAVADATGKKFTQHMHTLAWKRHKARPPSKSKNPKITNKDWCLYHQAHKDYTYSNEWVQKMIEEVDAP